MSAGVANKQGPVFPGPGVDITGSGAHNRIVSARPAKQRRSFLRRFWPTFVLGLICAAWCLMSQVAVVPGLRDRPLFLGPDGLLSFLERRTIDARFNARGPIPSPVKVVYVNVDSDSLRQLGNFPWNRAIFAEVIDALFDLGKIRAVGFDFVFSNTGIPNLGRDEAEQGSLALGRSVRTHQAVVLAASYASQGGFPFLYDRRTNLYDAKLPETPDFPVVGPTWGRVGLIDVVNDDVANVPVFAQTRHQTYLAMSLQLALFHYGLSARGAEIGQDAVVIRGDDGRQFMRIPLFKRQLMEPNWFTAWGSEEIDPPGSVVNVLAYAADAREGTPQEKEAAAVFFSRFQDSIVLVGPTDPFLKDITAAPLSEGFVPRVSLHGNMLKTIVSGRFIRRLPVWSNCVLIVCVGLATAALAAALQKTRWGGALALLLAAAYVGAAFALFRFSDMLVPVVAPLGCALSCTLFGVFRRLSAEEERRQRIKSLFGSYVSSAVVDEIVESDILPQTGGAEVEVTAFFSDVASFTSLSEKLPPAALVELMSEYFAEGTKAITLAGGTLDKYVGDAIIAMFGAPLQRPDHAAAACRAALALQDTQAMLRQRWSQSGRRLPAEVLDMHTRVGLNTGMAVVGNIGSELRFNYTMMGAAVNLAQRMEAAASHYGSGILVSSATAEAALRDDALLVFRELDRITVAGLAASVAVFELLGSGEDARESNRALLSEYAVALALYNEGRWPEAAEAFMSASLNEASGRRKNPCLVMASRCESFALEGRERGHDFSLTKNQAA
jgi:adenylate cyclase